jgi:hypothetical protein
LGFTQDTPYRTARTVPAGVTVRARPFQRSASGLALSRLPTVMQAVAWQEMPSRLPAGRCEVGVGTAAQPPPVQCPISVPPRAPLPCPGTGQRRTRVTAVAPRSGPTY